MAKRDADQQKFRSKLDKEKEYKKQLPGDDEDPLPEPVEPIQSDKHPGRNDPCSCGSGKKFKLCCGKGK